MDTFQANAKEEKERIAILSRIPHSPGVYVYRDVHGVILYIGKAIDLYKRVHQYFNPTNLPPKTSVLVGQIADIQIHKTLSEFDALLLESKLIYTHQPKYNILAKDDKSPLYVKLTLSEQLPRIVYMRKPRTPSYGTSIEDGNVIFGPFQSAKLVRAIMRALRRIIPYCTQMKRDGNPCFYTQIGLCHPCPSVIFHMTDTKESQKLQTQYRRNIFRLRDILSGRTAGVITELENEMKTYASHREFEKAAHIRNQVSGLYELLSKHYDPLVYTKDDVVIGDLAGQELNALEAVLASIFPSITTPKRIECIDISNTTGTYATGSLVVLSSGIPDTSQYRRFRIRQENKPNDVSMIREIIERRFTHIEWPKPDVFIVDGGKPQVSSAHQVFTSLGLSIPLIGLAKRQEEIVYVANGKTKIIRLSLTSPAIHILQRIRDEAHRFAIGYHKKLREQAFIRD
jgi:excinuclease ABC subunit C